MPTAAPGTRRCSRPVGPSPPPSPRAGRCQSCRRPAAGVARSATGIAQASRGFSEAGLHENVATGPCLATARRRLRASAGAVDDIDLQLPEFVDALVPYPGHRRPVFLRQRESVWQGGQLRRDFLEAEAGALPDRGVADL